MARKGRVDKGLRRRKNAEGKDVWYVRLYHHTRFRGPPLSGIRNRSGERKIIGLEGGRGEGEQIRGEESEGGREMEDGKSSTKNS